jgi:hypothetical protein
MSDLQPHDDVLELARQLDTSIRALAWQAHLVFEALYGLVEAAKSNNIHEVLGFPSWTAYLADALDGQWKVERDKRGEIIRYLAEQGMSQRAITAVTGVGKGTVYRELAGAPLGQLITGLDGKMYRRPEPNRVAHEAAERHAAASARGKCRLHCSTRESERGLTRWQPAASVHSMPAARLTTGRRSQGHSTSRSRTSSAWRWVSVLPKTCCRWVRTVVKEIDNSSEICFTSAPCITCSATSASASVRR